MKAGVDTMEYLIRFLSYIIRNLFVLAIVAALIVVSFFIAMNASNIFILLNDGLEKRASVILVKEDANELNKFFTEEFLAEDNLLKQNEYIDFIIRSFDHQVSIQWMWNWPWSNKATATVVERVKNIDGELPDEKKSDEEKKSKKKIPPPKWKNAKYKLFLVKDGIAWKIDKMVFLETVVDKEEAEVEKE
jgi:hypothetical protein